MAADLEKQHDLSRLRSTLETFAVASWRRRPDREAIRQRLWGHLEELKKAAQKGDYETFHAVDSSLHRELITSVEIPALVRCWDTVVEDLDKWIWHVQQVYWPSLMALYREHVLLLEAWDSPDSWIAEEATHQHLEAGWYRVAAARKNIDHKVDPVDRATSFISTHFASKIGVEWIAQNVSFVSTSHLIRLFKLKLNTSPHAYLKQTRLERSGELVRSTMDEISMIAGRVGYRNTSHFVRDFKKHFKMTPLAYRRQK